MSDLTKIDILKILKIIKINYNTYNGVSEEDMSTMVEFWFERLKQYPKKIVFTAFDKIINTAKAPPVLAHFIEQIENMQECFGKSEQELWLELCKAANTASILAGRFNCDGVPPGETKTQAQLSREALNQLFNDLDPVLKEYVASVQGLLNFAYTDLDYAETKFKKALPQLKARLKMKKEMPEEMQNLLNGCTFKQIPNTDE